MSLEVSQRDLGDLLLSPSVEIDEKNSGVEIVTDLGHTKPAGAAFVDQQIYAVICNRS
jgi:hypothetical protein